MLLLVVTEHMWWHCLWSLLEGLEVSWEKGGGNVLLSVLLLLLLLLLSVAIGLIN